MSNSQPFLSQSNKQAFRNPWVIGWLAGLILVVAVNAAFIITAFFTNPGLVDENYYESGQDYEQTVMTKLATRERLAWDIQLQIPHGITQDQVATLYVDIFDKTGARLKADIIMLNVYRPSDVKEDFKHEMTELAPGRFVTSAQFPLPGVWELQIAAGKGKDSLDIVQRIHVKKPK
jgi:nitrogen fixation protein FixH